MFASLIIWCGARTAGYRRRALELVRPLGQRVREVGRELEGLVLVDPVLGHQLGEITAVDASRDIVPGRDRQECTRIVVEADGIVKARGLCRLFAKAQHAFRTVVKPPRWPEAQRRIVP